MNKYDKKFMNSAIEWSTYSYCKRKQVGAVLVKDGREIASGYNGTITGAKSNNCEESYYQCPHCNEIAEHSKELFTMTTNQNTDDPFGLYIKLFCKKCNTLINSIKNSSDNAEQSLFEPINKTHTKDSVIHAERNVIAYCAKHGIATEGCTMYITLSPCQGCAVLMAQAGIKTVIYKDKYKDTTGIKILENKITIKQYKG